MSSTISASSVEFYDAVHAALGTGTCVFDARVGGSRYAGLQQGVSDAYYTILVVTYVGIYAGFHLGESGWTVKALATR